MKRDDKWSLFRNFLYNELDITKEDIHAWIKEAVREEADRMVGGGYHPKEIIQDMLMNHSIFGRDLQKEIEKAIKETVRESFKIEVSYKPKKKE